MLLLPGSLPTDPSTLAALGEALDPHPEIAERLGFAEVSPLDTSWTCLERQSLGLKEDLPAGLKLAQELPLPEAVQYAIATPLNVQPGLSDLLVGEPAQLQLSDEESRALCEMAHLHLRADGVRFHYIDRFRWLLRYKTRPLKVLTENPQWLVGSQLRPNLPKGEDALLLERWMNELQMLLHDHAVNTQRAKAQRPPVNLIWLWGFGHTLPTQAATPVEARQITALRTGDSAGWQRAWGSLSVAIQYAQPIVLGDYRARLSLQPKQRGRLSRMFKKPQSLLETLQRLQAQLATQGQQAA